MKPALKIANHLDLPFFIELEHRYFERYVPEGTWNTIEFKNAFARSRNFVIEHAGISIGVLRLGGDASHLYIHAIHIIEEYRNRGIGKDVLDTVDRLALDEAVERIRLRVYESNPAINLYKRCGFEVESQDGSSIFMEKITEK